MLPIYIYIYIYINCTALLMFEVGNFDFVMCMEDVKKGEFSSSSSSSSSAQI